MISIELIFLAITCFSKVKTDRVVMTNSGPVQGVTVSSGDLEVEAFLGIPYAEPPLGRLRFTKPVPKQPWQGVYDASRLPPPCIQNVTDQFYYHPKDENMTEDCLYLNLWVPYSNISYGLKPVIVFIHGGAFNTGSSNMQLYDGTRIANRGNVIVATLNYRVGVMGFFLAFIEEADGNMGIFDQYLAMQWIKSNAESFGGDPNQMTLMGESAGSMSISAHLVSPLTRNMFKRVIMQSGSAMHPFIRDSSTRILKMSQIIATMVGCADKKVTLKDDPRLIVRCLKRLPAKELSAAEGTLMKSNPITFAPRSGDAYLPNDTIQPIIDGTIRGTEMLIGVNKDEGTILLTAAMPQYFGVYGINNVKTITRRLAYQLTRAIFRAMQETSDNEIAEFYINRIQNGSSDIYTKAISESVGDYMINCATNFQAEFNSIRNPVYFYMFSHRTKSTPLAEWMGATHFDEVQYIWGNPLFGNFTAEEEELSLRMMDRWLAFAKTGNPNIPGTIKWPQFRYDAPEYLDIDIEESIRLRPKSNTCEFWRERFHANINDSVLERLESSGSSIASNFHLITISLVFPFIWIALRLRL